MKSSMLILNRNRLVVIVTCSSVIPMAPQRRIVSLFWFLSSENAPVTTPRPRPKTESGPDKEIRSMLEQGKSYSTATAFDIIKDPGVKILHLVCIIVPSNSTSLTLNSKGFFKSPMSLCDAYSKFHLQFAYSI